MSGLFGGGHKDDPTPQPVTLPAPAAATPEATKNQSTAQDEALRRAQAAGTIATSDTSNGKDDGTYKSTTLG